MEICMNNELESLNKSDLKTLESMFIVEMHSAERIFRVIENGLADIYRQSKDYKQLVKQYGKAAADKIVTTYTHRVLSHDEQYNCGKLLEVCKTLHHYMDRLTAAAIAIDPQAEDKGRKEMEMFDALQHDGNLLAYRHALMVNVRPEDEIKVDSMLKALAKDHTVSDRIIERLKV